MSDTDFLFSRRFGGIARLYGDDALQRFRKAHVCVVGVGGVGSWAVEALARTGIGRLTLIDLDNVAESNVNRQLHALTDDFGKPKVTALHERILQINPQCEVEEIEDFVDEDNLETIFRRPFDFVIDAIDQMRVKAAMAAYFVRQGQPFIRTADLSKVTHDPLLANLRYTLRKRYGFSRDTKEKMRVPCVYSTENITPPQSGGACAADASSQGLSCAGYGASMLVTATFGLYCAQAAVDAVAAGMRPSENTGKGKTR